eukprot:NODE_666_length_1960_cov_47.563557_g617_i0.p1 GENE.NODE_666_length_1960_cov_47.563557_g617_i0~~NODE_666_length_1960_cov_47.563557_g617_i0.p1  ORF type:complete len:625 (+),score=152.86 NODE_666_length_1960_cov_47.563557_g617_i0:69-1877(+)
MINREQREHGFKQHRSFIGTDDRCPTKAIPGYTGHLKNAKDNFGLSAGRIMQQDAAGVTNVALKRPTRPAAGSSFISSLDCDGSVWDHHYETTSQAMTNPTARAFATSPTAPTTVVGYTGHLHMSQDMLGVSHDETVRRSQYFRKEEQANRVEPTGEAKPHWTTFFTESKRTGGTWKQDYSQTITTRPTTYKNLAPSGDTKEQRRQLQLEADVKAAKVVLGEVPPPQPTQGLVAKFNSLKQTPVDDTINMGPASLQLYDNTLLLEAPEEEADYTGHFATALPCKRVVGYKGHLHGGHDQIGINFGRAERRTNPHAPPHEEKHPLGNRYQNSAPSGPQVSADVKALVKRPSRPKRSGIGIIDSVKTKIMLRGGRNGFRSLTRILRMMDDDGNKQLNRYELQSGLNDYGIHPSQLELDQLMVFFDRDGSGQVSVTEFMRALRGEMNPYRTDLVLQAYGLLDYNCDGKVTFNDISQLYDASQHPEVLAGEKTAKEVTTAFIKGWDKNGDSTITPAEFQDYYADLSAGIDDDQYFELMIRNAWHLSGGEGPAANTSCRRVLVRHTDGSETVQVIENDLGVDPHDKVSVIQRLTHQGVPNIRSVDVL